MDGRVDECTGGSFRCRSAPTGKPFCLAGRAGDFSAPAGGATFSNVMVHSTSSPANTVDSFQFTNTRMFEDMVGRRSRRTRAAGAEAVHWRGAAAGRVGIVGAIHAGRERQGSPDAVRSEGTMGARRQERSRRRARGWDSGDIRHSNGRRRFVAPSRRRREILGSSSGDSRIRLGRLGRPTKDFSASLLDREYQVFLTSEATCAKAA